MVDQSRGPCLSSFDSLCDLDKKGNSKKGGRRNDSDDDDYSDAEDGGSVGSVGSGDVLDLAEPRAKATRVLEGLQKNYESIRAGRFDPRLLDQIQVKLADKDSRLSDLAFITTINPHTFNIQPMEQEVGE